MVAVVLLVVVAVLLAVVELRRAVAGSHGTAGRAVVGTVASQNSLKPRKILIKFDIAGHSQ